MRKHVWYRVLDKVEREIVNLTISIIDEVRSFTLSQTLHGILDKVRDASKTAFMRTVESYGVCRAVKSIEQARRFGYIVKGWLDDEAFPRLLALNHMYNPSGWS
jgi:hypothetical protein